MKVFKEALYSPNGTDARSTISTSVVAATSILALTGATNAVFVDVQAQPVNVTFDGSDPAGGTNGHQLAAGYNAIWSKPMWTSARFIRQGASDAAVQVTPLTN